MTYVNGVEMSPVQIDTNVATTDTVDYVATDSTGLTSTSTRTVIIETPSTVPTHDASTTNSPGQGSGAVDPATTTDATPPLQ